jgi:hypothetical protein
MTITKEQAIAISALDEIAALEQPTYAELLDYVERLEASQKYLQGPAKSIVLGLVDDYAAAATNYYQGKETKELWEKMVAARKLVEDALK